MTIWFLLLVGIFTYLMVQHSVAKITRTPVWLLWLVLMAPALLWTGWTIKYGPKLPTVVVITPLIVSSLLYWLLFQWGRRLPGETQTQPQPTKLPSNINPTPEPSPLRPIEPSQETQLRNCFPWSFYSIQNIEYRPQAIICRGQLRSSPIDAYEKIKANVEAEFGDRFLVIFQEDFNGKPLFVLVPNPQVVKDNGSQKEKLTKPGLALLLLCITLITTTLAGTSIAGVDPKLFSSHPSLILRGLPYALALISILGIHELGHYFAARYYKIRSTLPYFIPVPFFLGTFGALIQMRSPVQNRKALFDIGIAGPLAGFIVTLPILIWGLAHSHVVGITEKAGILNIHALNPQYSILLAILSKLALGHQLTSQTAIDLHPVAVAGFVGLIVTALNLMPVGQLDGGHIVHAVFGQKTAILIGQTSRLLLLLLSLVHEEFFLWAIILLLLPLMDEPALNDVTDLDNRRDILGLLAMALLVLIVLPLPETIAHLLRI